MNTPRLVVLALAAVAAGGAAFLARGFLGGGTPKVVAAVAPPPVTSQVLVASSDLVPGRAVTAEQVHWQSWPKGSIDPSFITQTASPNIDTIIKGTVVRSPMVSGEPITPNKIIHADQSGMMAATLTPGMRAVSIQISIASLAGGFIQPNDRVDLVLTSQTADGGKKFRATTILHNVRVLAIDQLFDNGKAQKPVSDVKTATLELTPQQAERVTRAQASGVLSLSLRSMVEQVADGQGRVAAARAKYNNNENSDSSGEVSVIRYGVLRADSTTGGQ
jgi:pilus assembly protein CpaB